MSEAELKISDNIKLEIIKKYIEPSYTNDVDNLLKGKKCWRISGQIFETISKIFVAVGGIISFSSGYFNYPVLGFVAGGISTVSLALLQFSSFSYSENKKQSQELNIILKKLNVDTLPVLERSAEATSFKLRTATEYTPSNEVNMTPQLHDQILEDHKRNFRDVSEQYECKIKELLSQLETFHHEKLNSIKELDHLKQVNEHLVKELHLKDDSTPIQIHV